MVDPSTKPIVLFGTDTALLGAIVGPYPTRWRQKTAGRALHVVLEGSEPSTGQRWCRTYFLQHGQVATTSSIIAHIDRRRRGTGSSSSSSSSSNSNSNSNSRGIGVDSKNDHYDAATENDSSISCGLISYALSEDVSMSIHRLESLYMKLLISLRWLVKSVFSKHSDVLEAGTEIQVRDAVVLMMEMLMILLMIQMMMTVMMMMMIAMMIMITMMMMMMTMMMMMMMVMNCAY